MKYLEIKRISKAFGGLKVLQNLSFNVEQGEILGLIGPNGAGKSTFFNVVTGLIKADSGKINFKGKQLLGLRPDQVFSRRIVRTFQDTKLFNQITVLENLISAAHFHRKVNLVNVFLKPAILRDEKIALEERALDLLTNVHIRSKAFTLAKDLSYGQSKLVEILKVIISDSTLVLLDEPFSGLFPEMITIVSNLIKQMVKNGKTILIIEHNMKLIREVSDRVIVLDAGTKIGEGKFERVCKIPHVVEAYFGN